MPGIHANPEFRNFAYTDSFTSLLIQQAVNSRSVIPAEISAVQTVVLAYSAAFTVAEVKCEDADRVKNINSTLLSHIAQELILRGELVLDMDVQEGELVFTPAARWDVTGNYNESSWQYDMDIHGPSIAERVSKPSAGVLHPMWSFDSAAPWRGIPPLVRARLSVKTAALIEAVLKKEGNSPLAYILPIPVSGDSDKVAPIREDIENADGRAVLLKTTVGGFGQGGGHTPRTDWLSSRLGSNPPPSLIQLRENMSASILNCCGVPTALFGIGSDTREAWRIFLHASLAPLGLKLATELTRKLGVKCSISFENLRASDVQGRARSFASMAKEGMSLQQAASKAGLLDEGEDIQEKDRRDTDADDIASLVG